jgi:DNA-binding NarL/FixJ family response regulator
LQALHFQYCPPFRIIVIAQKKHVSVETECGHMVNIMSKLGAHSRLQALLVAVRHGIVELR